MRIFWIYGVARLDGLVRKPVGWAHEIPDEFFFDHFDFRNPLAGCRADPARNKSACGKAVVPGQWRSIHVRRDQRIGVESLLDWNAANERRNFAGNFV